MRIPLLVLLFAISVLAQIGQAEYYWDTDPGEGSATDLSLTDGNWQSSAVIAPATPGPHTLYVRAKGKNGLWSAAFGTPIYIQSAGGSPIVLPNLQVVQMEYWCGSEPSPGSATPVSGLSTLSGEISEGTFNIQTNNLVRGPNRCGVRTLGSNAQWSESRLFSLFLEPNTPPAKASIAGEIALCASAATSQRYTIQPEPAATYHWTPMGGTLVSFNDSVTVVDWDTKASVHSLSVVGSNAIGSGASASLSVAIEADPIIAIVQKGNLLTASATSPNWTYQWQRQGSDITNASASSLFATQSGDYTLIVQTQCGEITTASKSVVYDPSQTPAGSAPIIASSEFTIAENAVGALVGKPTLQSSDGTVITWSIKTAPSGVFVIDPANGAVKLTTGLSFDFEEQSEYSLTLKASSTNGTSDEQVFTVEVTDVNEAPVITSASAVTIKENNTTIFVTKLTASDPEDDRISCTITGGEDKEMFLINTSSCTLNCLEAMDFEKPVDSDRNNVYKLKVQVSDEGGLVATQNLVFTITDVKENSTSISAREPTTPQNSAHYEAYDLLGRPE